MTESGSDADLEYTPIEYKYERQRNIKCGECGEHLIGHVL